MVGGNGDAACVADGVDIVAVDARESVLVNMIAAITPRINRLVACNAGCVVSASRSGAIIADAQGLVVFDLRVHVPFGMHEHFLATQLIFETQFVEAITLMGLALDGHARLVFRQLVGRQLIAAVGAPGDHWLVGVGVDVLDDHILADAWDSHRAPAAACPTL
ncbi:hypothetical protein D3C79_862590 [compost metagenome]